MNFEDHFSKGSKGYARYRPHYPTELFAYLQTLTSDHELAWDCATGSGQAAHDLARYYDRVYASDASMNQVRQAAHHERIIFCVEQAERSSLANSRVDLVIVAVAVHWFNFEQFYAEVIRVMKPGGVLAVWTYHLPVINPDLDSFLTCFDDEILKAYWPERYQYLYNHYRTLPFKFTEVKTPELNGHWTRCWDSSTAGLRFAAIKNNTASTPSNLCGKTYWQAGGKRTRSN